MNSILCRNVTHVDHGPSTMAIRDTGSSTLTNTVPSVMPRNLVGEANTADRPWTSTVIMGNISTIWNYTDLNVTYHWGPKHWDCWNFPIFVVNQSAVLVLNSSLIFWDSDGVFQPTGLSYLGICSNTSLLNCKSACVLYTGKNCENAQVGLLGVSATPSLAITTG
jgi:hypothetical protein